jgi:hypothetical protein
MTAGESLLAIGEALEIVWFAPWRLRLGCRIRKSTTSLNKLSARERMGKRKRGTSNARTGVHKSTIRWVMESLGWKWTPTMQIGSGCTVHLKANELPSGRLVVSVSKHLTAVVGGVIHDTHDCSRGETRCVYGYWQQASAKTTS